MHTVVEKRIQGGDARLAAKISNRSRWLKAGRGALAMLAAGLICADMNAASVSATAGQSATFAVAADGTAPFTYQWYKNNTAISGATAASYTIAALTTADAGNYTAVVKNSAGSTTSDVAALSVAAAMIAPSITTQPSSVSVTAGKAASFSVTASGSATLKYQWQKNGASISGANSATYSIASAASADAGTYTVVVSNSAGSTTSKAATLTVSSATTAPTATAPSITSQPASITVATGASASFSVSTSGTAPFTYQWRKNGVNISGATSATYTISSVTTLSAGSYSVAVTNSAGSVISNGATLTVSSSSSSTVTPTKSIWISSAKPQVVDAGADNPVQLGLKFKSDVAGKIIGIRFYKASANTGTHTGNLWSSTGALLATATFTNETGSGWQTVTFSQPVSIAANTIYIAAYQTNVGHYSMNKNQFLYGSVDRAPLHALSANQAGGANGVFSYGVNKFPNQSQGCNNYWVDVLFQENTTAASPTAPTEPAPTQVSASVWDSSVVPEVVDGGADSSVEIGMKFRTDVTGTVTAIRFYKSKANTGTHVGNLWSADGKRLATVTFSNETASGWQQANLSTPVTLAANTTYIVSYHANTGHYAADVDYFTTDGADAEPLHALPNSTSGGNGVFAYGSTSAFPKDTYRSCNYWVDVVFKYTK
ncbi:MAG TPA: DUF4082 domain-containing protein [Opitutaceae bacterium]|nr:DUF4082 domain-containing protein [Opitutaceae bacterium]